MIVESCSGQHQQVESGQIRQEGLKLDSHETLIGAGILGSVSMVLGQSSMELFQVSPCTICNNVSTILGAHMYMYIVIISLKYDKIKIEIISIFVLSLFSLFVGGVG